MTPPNFSIKNFILTAQHGTNTTIYITIITLMNLSKRKREQLATLENQNKKKLEEI